MSRIIPLSEPVFSKLERKYLNDCLNSGWVSTAGPLVQRLENEFKSLVCSKFSVACNSGTSALHLALKSIGVKKNEYVIVSNLTFIASVNVIKYEGAIPILVDCCNKTAQIDVNLLREFLETKSFVYEKKCFLKKNKKRISAIIVVHLYGHSAEIDILKKLAKKFHLKIIEDAAESVGVKFNNKYLGTFGDIGCFSFNGNKIITSGAGGILVTNNSIIAKKCEILSQQGKVFGKKISYKEIGYNYKINNLNASLGLAQLQNLGNIIDRKRKIASIYQKELKDFAAIDFISPIKECFSTWWLFNIVLNKKSKINVIELQEILRKQKIESRRIWQPINFLRPYRKAILIGGKASKDLYQKSLSIPSSISLKKTEQIKIISIIKSAIT